MLIKQEFKICLECGNPFSRRDGERSHDFKRKKFCNRSCSSSHNNKKHPRIITLSPTSGTSNCQKCQAIINLKRNSANGGYQQRKYCDSCLRIVLSEQGARGGSNSPHMKRRGKAISVDIATLTKRELFKRRKNWQSARSTIRKHACLVYAENQGSMTCAFCGYTNHVQICHKTPVSQFPNDTLVSEINRFANLIALCPNHHWELDNGILKLE